MSGMDRNNNVLQVTTWTSAETKFIKSGLNLVATNTRTGEKVTTRDGSEWLKWRKHRGQAKSISS